MNAPLWRSGSDPAALPPRGFDTKLTPPAASTGHVLRPAVCEAIQQGQNPLVLVRAPAGFGKSTAMAHSRALLEEQGVATAWLTLDPADNDLSRCLAGLDGALRRLDMARTPCLSPYDLVQAWSRCEGPFALFLDDFETVHEPSVLSLVRDMIAQLPRRGRLVLGSRTLPALGLGRLRARGQLVEIDAERLRFSLEDTRLFLSLRQGPPLSTDTLLRLHAKTEGWIAALSLVSMALDRQEDPALFVDRFSGSDRSVADYLTEDVLARQTGEVRDFLLRTSLLRHLDAEVCAALLPRVDCQRMLEQLDAAHLLITPLSNDQRSWRYHSLFSDYLRQELARTWPQDVARLHLAASGWYESQGRPVPAIDHAIEGGDHPLALDLLEVHAEPFLHQGRMRLLARWFQALSPALLQQRPGVEIVAVWAASFTVGPSVAMAWLDQVVQRHPVHPGVQAHARCMRPMLLAMQDRSEEAMALGRDALADLPTGNPFADNCLLNAMAQIVSVVGDPREAQQLLDAARREQASHSTFHRMYTETTEGLMDLLQGRLRQASARFRLAVDATHAVNYHHTQGNAWAGVLYACTVYETNRLDEAEHLLNAYLPRARDVGLPDHMILSHAMRSRMAFQRGDVDAASLALTELEYLGHQRKLPRVVAGAKVERARMLMLQGNAHAARDELVRADDPTLWQREQGQRLFAHDLESMALANIRWDLAFGEVGGTLATIDREIEHAQRLSRHRRILLLRILRSLALQRQGELPGAVQQMGQVLQTACREGFMRLLLDEGPAVGGLVQRVQALHESGPAPDPLLGEYLQRLRTAFGPLPTEPEAGSAQAGVLDPLTRKEIRVLQLLVEGYSNSAMAEKLFVSDSTVRTHLRSINMKLGAHSRTQAVAIARKLGIV
ncbi:MAG: LuxR C-terminal-related transcriptional regulator [Burkholderiaceae bacterium]|nr:LuxR C-terminal-related transcriptional regulator [Burkholderiaceae bacterium]